MEPANMSDLLTPEPKVESKNEMEANIIELASMILIRFLLHLFSISCQTWKHTFHISEGK